MKNARRRPTGEETKFSGWTNLTSSWGFSKRPDHRLFGHIYKNKIYKTHHKETFSLELGLWEFIWRYFFHGCNLFFALNLQFTER